MLVHMLRVRMTGRSIRPVVAGTGDVIAAGRAPSISPDVSPAMAVKTTLVPIADSADHVSRNAFSLNIGVETARLRFHGKGEAQLSSLFEAPGGARRVTLTTGMSATLDEGDNQLVLLRGAVGADGRFTDLNLSIQVAEVGDDQVPDVVEGPSGGDPSATMAGPALERFGREWFVALALAEPWLAGQDDYPRPPSNREIYERVAEWHGYAWNLARPQRVDDSIKYISRLAFGHADDPFHLAEGRSQNVRFSVGRRAAEVRLVTAEDLAEVQRRAASRG